MTLSSWQRARISCRARQARTRSGLQPGRDHALTAAEKHSSKHRGHGEEVWGCDVVAVRGDKPPLLFIVEMKLSFTLELQLQAVDRMAAADEVWMTITASRRGRDGDRRVYRLCRLLRLGLLTMDVLIGLVSVVAEPEPYRPRMDAKKRRRNLKEHGTRRGIRLQAVRPANRA